MTAGKVDALENRVRQLREAAGRKGMLVHKAHGNQDDRYIILDHDTRLIKRSRNFELPYSFSLEEAEAYVA